jgi:O-antigen/teichoic acid export membrane protein
MRTLMKYSAGIYLATLMITLREPLYKVFLSRTYGLEEVATFEIAFRLCTQLISAAVSPLLGVFVAAAVLAKRPEELSAMVRPVFAASLLVLPPLAAAAVAFSDVAVGWWLGAAGARVAQLLPWMLSGFALYYCTEVLYQGLLGSGRPAYASFVQTSVLAVMAAVLFLARRADAVSAVGWSMCAGLAIFSVCNVFAFRRMISQTGLFAVRDVLLLATPTVAFCLTRSLWGEEPAVAASAFVCYLVLHIVVAKALGIADLKLLVQRVISRMA